MKKVVYDTETCKLTPKSWTLQGGTATNSVEQLEMAGYHVTLSRDVPDEPKVERCEIITVSGSLSFYSRRHECYQVLDNAVNYPDFAGFEFEDGEVRVAPWKKCRFIDGVQNLDHAKFVLFRVKP